MNRQHETLHQFHVDHIIHPGNKTTENSECYVSLQKYFKKLTVRSNNLRFIVCNDCSNLLFAFIPDKNMQKSHSHQGDEVKKPLHIIPFGDKNEAAKLLCEDKTLLPHKTKHYPKKAAYISCGACKHKSPTQTEGTTKTFAGLELFHSP